MMKRITIIISLFLVAIISTVAIGVLYCNYNNSIRSGEYIVAEIENIEITSKDILINRYKSDALSYRFSKALTASNELTPVKMDFTIINNLTEPIMFDRIKLDSNNYQIIYNSKRFNICEAPIILNGQEKADFTIYFLVESKSNNKNYSEQELADNLKETIEIQIYKTYQVNS